MSIPPPPAEALNHTVIVDTQETVATVIKVIETVEYLILDCEGLDLGHIGGQLSIIILRPVTEGATTYIIDVMALDSQALQPIFNLIQADSPIKVVYDGRMDYTELNTTFDVKMGKTLDMQIVDVLSRRTRGQPLRKQIRRFPQWLRKYAFQSPSFYTDIHNLSSLGYAMKEHEIQDVGKTKVDHGKWLDRPLSQEYLNYAANDVRLIELLYHKLSEKSFIYDVDELAITSQRYLNVWNGERTALDDKFTQHSLLPLNIVDYDDSADSKRCSKCWRMLPHSSNYFGKSGSAGACKVCHTLRLREKEQKGVVENTDTTHTT